MKRRMLFASLAALLAVLLALPVLAHPGRTDSKGGHFDHSSGTYHYHHGYPAHQHRDLDGDGKPDCPYDFDDKTNHSSGSSSGSSSSSRITPTVKPTEAPTVAAVSSGSRVETANRSPQDLLGTILMIFTLVIVSPLIIMLYIVVPAKAVYQLVKDRWDAKRGEKEAKRAQRQALMAAKKQQKERARTLSQGVPSFQGEVITPEQMRKQRRKALYLANFKWRPRDWENSPVAVFGYPLRLLLVLTPGIALAPMLQAFWYLLTAAMMFVPYLGSVLALIAWPAGLLELISLGIHPAVVFLYFTFFVLQIIFSVRQLVIISRA